MLDLSRLARALGGEVSGRQVLCPGPGHSARDRSLAVRFDGRGGFLVHSFSGDDWRACRDHVKASLRDESTPAPNAPIRRSDEQRHAELRIKLALATWEASRPLPGTLGERYFVEHRRLDIGRLGDLSHAIRWYEATRSIVALMTSPERNEPRSVHRTFLDLEGRKIDRKMLGRVGLIRLSPDEGVTHGLGICEGVEDGLAALLGGWSPVWAVTCAGAMATFSVLRWAAHGREVRIQ